MDRKQAATWFFILNMQLFDAILETQQLHVKMYSSLITNAYVCDDHGGKEILYYTTKCN